MVIASLEYFVFLMEIAPWGFVTNGATPSNSDIVYDMKWILKEEIIHE